MRAYYQPVVEAASGRVAAHEALLRWQHPARGVIEPGEFIQLAEDTGLILPLGEWLLARGLPLGARLIGAERGAAGERQPLGAPVQRPEARRARGARAEGARACRRSCSSWRSPRRWRCSSPTSRSRR